jgi:kynureninase
MDALPIMRPEDLYATPNALAPHYSRFRVAERLLLTGHSHQAWPDCAREGQILAWDDAAAAVDGKWPRAFEQAERVRRGYAERLGDTGGAGLYVLAANTHDVLVRFLSALPLRRRPRLLTTDGEFHTVRRQLDRLEEEGIAVTRIPVGAGTEAESVTARLAAAVDDTTAAVLVSSVFFRNAFIAEGFAPLAAACHRVGAELLVDTYHTVNAIPFELAAHGLEDAFLVGGGYKYCQLGEGNCFLRVPAARSATFRPVITGWYGEFSALGERTPSGQVSYGEGPDRWAGATYDPTSHYRAAAVWAFFDRMDLTPERLRQVSQHQVGLLAESFDALDLPPAVITRDRALPLERIAGFLALTTPRAGEFSDRLRAAGVLTDSRDDVLRLGPAPYLSDRQLRDAVGLLGEVVRG